MKRTQNPLTNPTIAVQAINKIVEVVMGDGVIIATAEEAMEEGVLTNNKKEIVGYLTVMTRASCNVIIVKNIGITP